jgi:site-specific DNA-methyltransferase (adenine-specific)
MGHRPGHYNVLTQTGRSGKASGLVGSKDLEGMRALVRDYSLPGDIIIDPFAGLGTTLVAACIEGRVALGAERRGSTHRQAMRRLASAMKSRVTADRDEAAA